MKVDTMRAVDRFVGIPLCHVAGIVRRFFPQEKSSTPREWRSVLIIKFFGLGSVLLSSSFVAALHQRLPHIRIIYLTFGANSDILERMPLLSRRLTVSTSSIRHFIRDSLNALRVIRHEPVDAVFDLEFFSKFSTLMSSLSGAPVRVGYALPTRWRTMNVTVPVPFRHNRHVSEVFVSQLEAVGLAASVPPVPVSIKPLPSDVMSMERTLNLRTNGFAIVAININAGPTSLERRWPPHRFIEVCRDLLKGQQSVRFIFSGSAEERTYVEEALFHDADVRRASINAAGMLSLGELIALLQRSSLILTNDSGPMHIAAALGRPVVALFGPESPAFYGPPAGTTRTIYKAVSCSPCLNVYNAKLFVCPYQARCMKEISTTDVLDAIRSLRPVLTT